MSVSTDRVKIKACQSGNESRITHFLRSSNQRFNLADTQVSAKQITEDKFKRALSKFDIKKIFLAWYGGELLGVMFLENNQEKGQIPVFVIKETCLEEVGKILIEKAYQFFSSLGIKAISIGKVICPYPLVSKIRLEDKKLTKFLSREGFKDTLSKNLTMILQTSNFKIPNLFNKLEKDLYKKGVHFRQCQTNDFKPLLNLVEDNFASVWKQFIQDVRDANRLNFIQLILLKEKIIGFASYIAFSIGEPEICFGPIGVVEKYRGKGKGTVLLIKSLQDVVAHSERVILSTTTPTALKNEFFLKGRESQKAEKK